MVHGPHFLSFNDNNSYNHNMNSFDLSDQHWNVYQDDHWIRKYKLWWSLFFWGHLIVLVNEYIIYKTICEKCKINPTSHYGFRRRVFLANIEPTFFCGGYHLVLAVRHQGIRENSGSTRTTTVS